MTTSSVPSPSPSFGQLWNTFWYSPAPCNRVACLRIALGACTLIYLLLWSVDLERFLAPNSVLPPADVSHSLSADPLYYPSRFSLLDYLPNRSALWGFHIAAIAAASLLTLGIAGRAMALLTLVMVLSYVHRAPLLMSPQEPLLCWGLMYLFLAPSSRCFSFDALWSKSASSNELSIAANVAVRLMQIHLTLHYFFVAVTQLSDRSWWNGSAVWILMAQSRTRGLDLMFMRESTFLLNGLTHLLVALALSLAILPWNRAMRPIVNWFVIPYALLIAAITGLWIYACVLLALQVVFLSDATLDSLQSRLSQRA